MPILDWFGSMREALRRESMSSEVRSSDLEIGLSFSAGTAEMDTAASLPSSSQPSIYALP